MNGATAEPWASTISAAEHQHHQKDRPQPELLAVAQHAEEDGEDDSEGAVGADLQLCAVAGFFVEGTFAG
jgi:hypothetical protein